MDFCKFLLFFFFFLVLINIVSLFYHKNEQFANVDEVMTNYDENLDYATYLYPWNLWKIFAYNLEDQEFYVRPDKYDNDASYRYIDYKTRYFHKNN